MDDLTVIDEVFAYAGQNGTGITVNIGANVTKIPAYLFHPYSSSYAPKITSVIFASGSICESIGSSAFSGCDSLETVTIPDSVTSIGSHAFDGCKGLTEINFNATAMDDLSSSNFVFAYAGQNGTGITVNIGANVTKIPAYLFYPYSISSYASKITSITIPGSVTSIGAAAFYGCYDLTSVNYTGKIEQWAMIEFENYSYNPLYYAKQLYINGVEVTEVNLTTATYISDYAFQNCESITSVTIGDSVTSIGSSAFSGCSALTSITFTGTKEQWNAISKGSYWNSSTGSYTIHCTDGDIAKS